MDTGLISNAFVIGVVSAAVYQTEKGLRALRLDEEGGYVDCSRQAGLLLDCPGEQRLLVGASLQEIKQCLGLWSRRQQLLQQLIGGMDGALREETRQMGLELAEKGLADVDAAHFARARLLACPPPADADLDNALRLSASFPHCQQLYSELAAAKDYIAPTAQVLQELVYFDFPSTIAPDELYRTLVDRGVVAEAVTLSVNPGTRPLSGLVFQFRSDAELQRYCPRLTHLLTKFVNRLQALYPKVLGVPVEKGTQQLSETASDTLVEAVKQFLVWHRRNRGKRPSKHRSADKAREAADKQKAYILQCMSKGRLPEVKKALLDLVYNQARTSLPKHLCKSLCDLGAQFTAWRYFDFAISAYTAAQLANPNDPFCWTGYAETLRELGRPEEALDAYTKAKDRFANDAVCWTGYVETLRELGRPEEALDAYAKAKDRFANDAVCWTGYAETLRELGRPEEAIAAYQETMSRFPRDGVARNALACLFVEREEYENATELLTVEQPRSLQNWRDFHVLAMAKLNQGFWAETQAMLERGMTETPFAHQRQVFQTSLAVLALRRKQPNIAEGNLEISNAQIIQFPLRAVLRAHAVAAQYRTDEAQRLLEQVKGYKRYGEIVDLAEVLARRYGLGRLKETAPELDLEIERRELALALRAA